jgi:hypothetical protein
LIALSTTKAEYLTLSTALRNVIPLKELSQESTKTWIWLYINSTNCSLSNLWRQLKSNQHSKCSQVEIKNQEHQLSISPLSTSRNTQANYHSPHCYRAAICRYHDQDDNLQAVPETSYVQYWLVTYMKARGSERIIGTRRPRIPQYTLVIHIYRTRHDTSYTTSRLQGTKNYARCDGSFSLHNMQVQTFKTSAKEPREASTRMQMHLLE